MKVRFGNHAKQKDVKQSKAKHSGAKQSKVGRQAGK